MVLEAIDINNNGISAEAFTFFTAIVGLIGVIITGVFKLISDNRTLKREAEEASKNASQAVENTKKVGNGFADRVDRKLDAIGGQVDDIAQALNDHLSWHLNNSSQRKEDK